MNEKSRALLERLPVLYLNLLKVKRRGHWSLDWVVAKNSDFCIEGFPRSANSFARAAFTDAQTFDRPLKVATHTHSPAQIIQAARWGIPTMVCVRRPRDSVRGLLSFGCELQSRENQPAGGDRYIMPSEKTVRSAIDRWHFFHRQILPVKARLFLARFEDITADFSAVSQAFIDRFNMTGFRPYDATASTPESIMAKSFHIGPTADREVIKQRIAEEINSGRFSRDFNRCDQLYESLWK